ncbi:MAG TPA: SPOR domain-containing protein [Sphingomicrobium sp.]
MAGTGVALEADRLPWLKDEQPRRRRAGGWRRAALGILGMALIAALFYWIGSVAGLKTRQDQSSSTASVNVPSADEPAVLDEQQMPEVSPSREPPPVALPRDEVVNPGVESVPGFRYVARRPVQVHRYRPAPAATGEKAETSTDSKPTAYANSWDSAGVSGRMVRIGTYSSLHQGKQAWSRLAKAFPGMKLMPAVVTDIPSLRNGRTYYRLQIGTTSQAHSEVLCQRMRAIGQSCVVVDLAGARKGSWDERQPAGL